MSNVIFAYFLEFLSDCNYHIQTHVKLFFEEVSEN